MIRYLVLHDDDVHVLPRATVYNTWAEASKARGRMREIEVQEGGPSYLHQQHDKVGAVSIAQGARAGRAWGAR